MKTHEEDLMNIYRNSDEKACYGFLVDLDKPQLVG